MKINLLKVVFAILILFSFDHSFSHGPSRQKVSESIEINNDAGSVWKIVKNFTEFNWNPDISKIEANSNEIGSERTINFTDGSSVVQQLEKINEEKKMIGWRIKKTDNKVLPVNSYAAKVFVKSTKAGSSLVTYKAGFYRGYMANDPPVELNDENSKKKVSKFIKKSLDGLKKIAEKN